MSQYIFTIILVSIGLGMCPFRNAIAQISEQPLLKAPWRGVAQITQGNRSKDKDGSHLQQDGWENIYAIDVYLKEGSDVLAPADGVIAFVDDDPGGAGGKELVIEHMGQTGKKFYSVFLHLSWIFVKSGSAKEGDVVALSGNTGTYTTGDHLHFHLWSAEDPGKGKKSYDSHTKPIERFLMKQVGSEFKEYDARKGELDDDKIAWKSYESPFFKRIVLPDIAFVSLEMNNSNGNVPVLITPESSPLITAGGTPFQPLSASIVPFSQNRLGTLNIAFASSQYTDDSDQEIYIKNLDKPEFLRVTNNSFAHDSYPSWSPDGTKLAFVSTDKDKGGDNGIYIMELATGLITLLTDKPAQDFNPSWSPDSKRIVFWSSRGAPGCDSEIYVIDADGSNLRQLTDNSWGDIWPSWPPKGDLIAYESQEHGSNDGDIYLMNPNGGGRQRFVGWTGPQSQPAWSPDGTKLAYISGGEVHAINIDGSDDRVITNTGGRAKEPAWSPDGSRILFGSDHQASTIGKGGVYIINADGSSEELLIVSAEQPSWSPVLAQVETEMETLAAEVTELDFQDSDVAEVASVPLLIASDSSFATVIIGNQTSLSVLNLPAPILLSPENGAVGIAIRPDLVWTNSAPDAAYELQVSVTPSFTSPMTFENNGGFDYYGIANRAFPWSWSEYIHVAPLANNTTYYWRVKPQRGDWSKVSVFATVALPTTAVEDEEMTKIPLNYHLARNYPNPFNSETVISYELPEAGRVKLAVYDLSGQEIKILADQDQPAGQHQAIWNGQDDNGRHVSSGLYLYKIEVAKQFSYTRKMVLNK